VPAFGTDVMARSMTIPLVDLGLQHDEIEAEVGAGFTDVCRAGCFVGGPAVAAFEHEFAQFVGVRHCVGVGNGTDAIELALHALGVRRGAEVVVPANTFVATAEAVARSGARPVLVDVDDEFLLMDPEATSAETTGRTRVILPVHLYGQPAPVERLRVVAEQVGAFLLEDAAHAHGARRDDAPAGGLGVAAATSFYPGKNLGAYGDAGAVLTDDDEVARRVRLIGNHGRSVRYHHAYLGFNSRLDTVQAVVLRAKLRRLVRWNAERRKAAARYHALLAGVDGVRTPRTMPGNEPVWHLYVVRVPRRDRVLRRLNDRGIGAAVHYPIPLHLQGAFAYLGYRPGSFPVSEAAAGEILSLPLYPGITAAQQERVAEELDKAVQDA
jgi:dTDP-4-amino-4,6-dideoxygalactose transaminase